jgi:Thioredoxin
MDMFLTNGKSRSVPMFIFIDENGKVVSKFGPRPKAAIEMMDQLHAEGMDAHDVKEKLHLWYARDKHHAIEQDIVEALS